MIILCDGITITFRPFMFVHAAKGVMLCFFFLKKSLYIHFREAIDDTSATLGAL
jgi:hypothetical protein